MDLVDSVLDYETVDFKHRLSLSDGNSIQGNSIHVGATANAQQAQGVVLTTEKRRELQEKIAKCQEERAAAEEAEIERRVQARLAARGAKELPDKS